MKRRTPIGVGLDLGPCHEIRTDRRFQFPARTKFTRRRRRRRRPEPIRNDAIECRAAPWCAPEIGNDDQSGFRGMDQGPALHQLVSVSSFVKRAPTEWIRLSRVPGVEVRRVASNAPLAGVHFTARWEQAVTVPRYGRTREGDRDQRSGPPLRGAVGVAGVLGRPAGLPP